MMSRNRRVIDRAEFCMGCGLCRLACQVAHSPYPKDIIRAMKTSGEKPIPRMCLEVSLSGNDFRTVRCRHCDDPECLKVCIAGAIRKDTETGIVAVDALRCVGCWSCVLACPEGAITGPASGQGRAVKCDLCVGLENPACAAICPNEALLIKEIAD